MSNLQIAEPIFASRNLDQSQAFYTEKLGFELDGKWDNWLILKRGDIRLHFDPNPRLNPRKNTCQAIVYVDDIENLYAELNQYDDTIHPNAPLRTEFYGRTFAVNDPDGGVVMFIESSE